MRLGTVLFEGRKRVVTPLDDDMLLDLDRAAEMARYETDTFKDMQAVIEEGDYALEQAEHLLRRANKRTMLKTEDVQFLAPIMPVQYRDCLVFEDHLFNCLKAFGQAEPQVPPVWSDQPIYYKGNRMSFIGHEQDVLWPGYAEHLDLELELAIIIGKQGKNIAPEKAHEHIFG